MHLKMHGLPRGYKLSLPSSVEGAASPSHELVLEQLVDVKNCVVMSLELLAPRRTGKKVVTCRGEGEDAGAVLERLKELKEYVDSAKAALKGQSAHRLFPFYSVDPQVSSSRKPHQRDSC